MNEKFNNIFVPCFPLAFHQLLHLYGFILRLLVQFRSFISILAKSRQMNYVNICTPVTLRLMAEQLPTTKAALTQIDGFPDQKYSKFDGIKFLNITTEYNLKVSRKKIAKSYI